VALYRLERLEEAAASCRLALEVDPSDAETHNNFGVILHELGRPYEAMKSFEQAVEIKTDVAMAEAHLVHQRQRVCEFLAPDLHIHAANHLGITGKPIRPFLALSWADNPEQHLLRARAYCIEEYKAAPQSLPVKPAVSPPRLKIGYFSADFHDFPGMYLMAGLLESHDRERFEVYAFSYGPDRDDAMRRRIVAAVDHFIDIREMSTQEAVDLSRKHGIDIALHRNGHTKGSRTELFQHRLAPVQVSYLGYPGTLGADFIDYLVADPVVIPAEERQYYCEKIIYLPDTYQPNDNTRQIAETSTTRADFNLPEDAFVFCCFNQNYKISPREFDIWMRVLGNVEGSVLWLLNSNVWAVMNLKKEAERRGIDPSRLIFAEKIPHAEHLARHKHADLFVDTFNYNAHTTASDALWAGLPVVTKQGRQFAARVAASLLTAVGLPELITESEEDYERLILNLAQDRQKLSAIKATLEENRRTEPLFDTQRYTRHLESGLIQCYQQYFCGSDCVDIWVRD
jgi:predicted O-linked N-acetylglucosamine transferase (SPINDLY family)